MDYEEDEEEEGEGRRHEDERREFVVMFLNEFYMN
jgi:hypothetical protein